MIGSGSLLSQMIPARRWHAAASSRIHVGPMRAVNLNGDCATMAADLRKHRLGWIGLGRMGYAMAERLAKAGADVRGYNRTRMKAEGLAASGVVLVDRPADLADCDIVLTMVSTADDLKS